MNKIADYIVESSKNQEVFESHSKKIDDALKVFEKRWKNYKTIITKNIKKNPNNAETLMGSSEKQILDYLDRANKAFPLWAEHG